MAQSDEGRLAKLEANFEFIKELLKEIRDDIKTLPGKEDYDSLKKETDEIKKKISKLEREQTMIAIKVGTTSGIIGIVTGVLIKLFIGG